MYRVERIGAVSLVMISAVFHFAMSGAEQHQNIRTSEHQNISRLKVILLTTTYSRAAVVVAGAMLR
jgi:hypothetical protein